jgi:hypothetical protein
MLRDEGAVIVDGFIDRAVVDAIRREIEEPFRAADPGMKQHDAIGSGGGYLGMLGLRDPVELMQEGKLGRP